MSDLLAAPSHAVAVSEEEWLERMRTTSAPTMQVALVGEARKRVADGDLSAALALAHWQAVGQGGLRRDDLAALDAYEVLFDSEAGLRARARAAAIHLRLGGLPHASTLSQAAAEGGDPAGMVVLGDVLSRDGADPVAAARWYRRAHEAGHLEGSLKWAQCLLQGRGVGAEPAHAESVLKRLADDGIGEACFALAELKGRTATSLREHNESRAYWLSRAAADGHVPAIAALPEARIEQAWDLERQFHFHGVQVEAFVKTGVLKSVSTDRRSTVVGAGASVRTVHHESPVYEVQFESGVQKLTLLNSGQTGAAPGTALRMLVVGKAGSLEGRCVSLTDERGNRYSLAEPDEVARSLGLFVPKAGPAGFWAMVAGVLLLFSWNYFPPTLLISFVGAAFAGYFLYRNLTLSSRMWTHLRRLEDFWRGQPVRAPGT